MKKSNKKIYWFFIIIITLIIFCMSLQNKSELQSIKSEKQLYSFYDAGGYGDMSFLERVSLLPFSIFYDGYQYKGYRDYAYTNAVEETDSIGFATSKNKDYSKTNVQVEGVDEADIIKTDGDYIYSILGKTVLITNVQDPKNVQIEARISLSEVPNDLLLYENKLIIVAADTTNSSYYEINTVVKVYDITDKKNPQLVKSVELFEPYYTTRCIEGRLYVFSSGPLRVEGSHVYRRYREDYDVKDIPLTDIKYLKDTSSNVQTLIAEIDLNKVEEKVKVQSYLIDISNAYVSEDNIYLLDQVYQDDDIDIKDLFGLKGVIGLFESVDYSYEAKTQIYKFKMNQSKGVSYISKKEVSGRIVNQYSLDEKDGNLRIALQSDEGTRVVVFDEVLHVIGQTENVARGEIMYSSRFMGDKAYLVTYQNTDPLFVIDLSDERHPNVMGELHVPGYSTYLHPYDDTHLIGIGMETEENIIRDDTGKVISTRAVVTGMKMSLFDVSDIHNPKQIAKVKIGDSRTVSAILTNPKALLFSKEKELLAIPVNHYEDDFTINDTTDIEEEIDSFVGKSKSYVGEGYFVYHIDLENGFQLKGIINHDKSSYSKYYQLLRGIYINDDLFTVSQSAIQVHELEELKQIGYLKLSEEGVK